MRKSVSIPSEVNAKEKWEKLDVKDGFIIIGSIGVGFLISMVLPLPQLLQTVFVALFPVTTWLGVYPNQEVPKKKNYQVVFAVLRKRRVVYHRDSKEEIEKRVKKKNAI